MTGVPEEVAVPSRRNTTLKVIKGAKADLARRRRVTRVVTRPAEPVEQVLRRLDREPVADPADGLDPGRAEDTDVVVTDREAAPDVTDGRRGPARPRALVGLLVVLLSAALAAAGVEGHRWYVDRATEQARREAVVAARQAAVNFVSVSAASVDRDLQRVTAGSTGDFKDEFTRGQAQVRTAVVENKVQSRGSVLRAGLVSGDRRHAVALVAVDATVRNVKAPDGRLSHYRIQLDLVRDGDTGEWLVSRLQFVG